MNESLTPKWDKWMKDENIKPHTIRAGNWYSCAVGEALQLGEGGSSYYQDIPPDGNYLMLDTAVAVEYPDVYNLAFRFTRAVEDDKPAAARRILSQIKKIIDSHGRDPMQEKIMEKMDDQYLADQEFLYGDEEED